ncbi:enoyl-CoA hydratase-related protein [Gulosibacter massiliensis]|uniref:enoyl-CoA hydratase-related protein n=1 Tax=Gulosibacter massiliensis TaxID=2479839 RepID=UPI000F63CFB2|nr:enoyl-CoA hydratase-related protein [Gulosibacter massiliensis]
MPHYDLILTETRNRVGYITLNRPEALNALNLQLSGEIIEAALAYDTDPEIGAIVITGSERAFAADTAKFGQPEINLGVIPGTGGSQRLPAAIGKYKAAEMLFTARVMNADEADRAGLVSRVVPAAELLDEATAVAETIAAKSLPVVYAMKNALRVSQDSGITDGVRYEQQAFTSGFSLHDQKEGMAAFREKRDPEFRSE